MAEQTQVTTLPEVSFFPPRKNGKVGIFPTKTVTLDQVIQWTRDGSYAEQVADVRKSQSKKEKDFFKKQIPFVTWSGTFAPQRLEQHQQTHSGYIVFDFDHNPDPQALKLQLQTDPYVTICFISPSGDGVKAVVAIKDKEKHRETFADAAYYFNNVYRLTSKEEKVDVSGSDPSRACFISHDPEIYYDPTKKLYAIQNLVPPKPKTERQLAQDADDVEKHVAAVVERLEHHSMDICNDYNDWLLIGFSLCTLGERGRSYYHRVSALNDKYNEADAGKKFDNALHTSRFTNAGKFFSICKDLGVDVSRPKNAEKPAKITQTDGQARNDLDELLIDAARIVVENQTANSSIIQRTLKLGYNRAIRILNQLETVGIVGPANEAGHRAISFSVPEIFEEYLAGAAFQQHLEAAKKVLSASPAPDEKTNVTNSNNDKPAKKDKKKRHDDNDPEHWHDTVWYTKSGGIQIKAGKYFDEVAPNFQIFIKYKTEDEQENVTWVLEIKRNNGKSEFIEVPHEEFCSARKLKSILATKSLGFKIKDGHLDELQSYLFTETTFSTALKVVRYGYHAPSNVYFFSNKALNLTTKELVSPDEFGIVTAGDYNLSIPKPRPAMRLRFTLTDQDVTFAKFWNLYANAHLYENAFLPACFYIFSLFRDLGLKFSDFSPILYLKGGAGTGKSSMVRVLTAAFGYKQEGVNLKGKNTDASLVKIMSQSSNGIVWFDEFYNGLPNEGLLQAAYDNNGYHKSGTDLNSIDTDSVDLYSAVALTSNYIPENPVFFTRCVFIPIVDNKKTEDQQTAYNTLKPMEEAGLGAITIELLKYRDLLVKDNNYLISYKKLYKALKSSLSGQDIAERLIANMAQVMTAAYILHVAKKINMLTFVAENEQEILDEFVDMGIGYILRQNSIQAEKTAASEFFNIIQMLYDKKQILEGFHFRLEKNGDISIHFRKMYQLFQREYFSVHRRIAPDRDTIQSDLTTLRGETEWSAISKTIRFKPDVESNCQAPSMPASGACVLNYKQLQDLYSLDLESMPPSNN